MKGANFSARAIAALQGGRVDAVTMSVPNAALLKDPNLKEIERAVPFTGRVENGREVKNYAAIVFRSEGGEADIAPVDLTAKSLCPDNYR